MTLRGRLRRIGLGLATLFGPRPRGFFVPHSDAAGLQRSAYPTLDADFRRAEPTMVRWLNELEACDEDFRRFRNDRPPAPRWEQDWFPRLDAATAYALVRQLRPKLIVEIGSGHSTRFLARAVREGSLECEIFAVDPAPRASIDALPEVTHIARPLQECLSNVAALVERADILFVDSSHVLMPGTDVDCILAELLPAVPAGARVHFHDIFLPDGYPESWGWRGYNEQAAVAALLATDVWQIEFASHYATTRIAATVAASAAGGLPLLPGAVESSLWLRKR